MVITPQRPPIKVAFCIDSMDLGGTELNAVRTAEGLPRSKVDLQLAVWNDGGPLRQRFVDAGVPITTFPLRSFRSPGTLKQGMAFYRWLKMTGTQVVHAHDIYSNIFSVPFARLARVPFVVASRRFGSARDPVLGAFNQQANRLAHLLITNSVQGAEHLGREGARKNRIRVLPNFVEDWAFDLPSPEKRQETLRGFGLPAEAKVVGMVANLTPWKDHLTLLRGFALVAKEFPDWVLLGFGEGPEREAIEKMASELGIAARVFFPGWGPHRPNLHGYFDISTLVSPDEGSPNTILEAMAAGRPVVATKVGGIPDLIQDQENGILIPPRDPGSLARALKGLVRDPETGRRMGEAGRKRARERHSRSTVLDQLLGLYYEGMGLPKEGAHASQLRA